MRSKDRGENAGARRTASQVERISSNTERRRLRKEKRGYFKYLYFLLSIPLTIYLNTAANRSNRMRRS